MSKYLEYFDGAFDSTVVDKMKPENKPYVGYSNAENKLSHSLFFDGIAYDNILEENLTDNDILINRNKYKRGNITITRNFKANMWNTITLPFDLYDLKDTPFEDCEFKYIKNITKTETDTTITISPQTEILTNISKDNPLKAGYPYIVIPKHDITGPITFKNVTLKAISNKDCHIIEKQDGKVVAVINPVLLSGDRTEVAVFANSTLGLHTKGPLNGFRWYIKLKESV